jgi:hypothetical protein
MSEGIQGQKAIEEEELANSSQQQQQQGQRGGGGNPLVLGIDQGPRARKAALLVQAYGRTPQGTNSWGANSDTLFVSFIRNLVSTIRKFIRICHFFLPPTPSTKVRPSQITHHDWRRVYSHWQVHSLQGDSTDKVAVALLNSLDTAFKAQGPGTSAPKTWTWDPELRQSVLHILETHQVSNCGTN